MASKSNCAFKGRAKTILKLTRELSTLCGTPACAVIYNPNDVINPWLIWPDDQPLFRRVVQLYENSPMPHRPCNPPISTSCGGGGETESAAQVNLKNVGSMGFRNETFGGSRIPNKRSYSDMSDDFNYHRQPPATTRDNVLVLAGKETPLAAGNKKRNVDAGIDSIAPAPATDGYGTGEGMLSCEWGETERFALDELLNSSDHDDQESYFYAADCAHQYSSADSTSQLMLRTNVNDDAGVDLIAVASATDVHVTSDAMLSCEWEESEIFELDELLNSSDHEEENDFYAADCAQQSSNFLIGADSTSQLMPALTAVVSSNNRKAAEQVFSFSELMALSSQRRGNCSI